MFTRERDGSTGWICAAVVVAIGLMSGAALAQVGDCVEGMYNVYDRACEPAELESDMCTTRREFTPEAFWCCCDDEYPLSGCARLFDGIFGTARSTASNAMTISGGVRDNLLDKSALGKEYIKIYYANVDNATRLLMKHPKLAVQTAAVFRSNMGLLIDLSEGRSATLAQKEKRQVLKLLKAYSEVAGGDSEIGRAVERVHRDLESGKSLAEFGIKLGN